MLSVGAKESAAIFLYNLTVVYLLKPEQEVNLSHMMYDILWDVTVKEKHVEKMDK